MSDKWSKEKIIHLIELYENASCLWDSKSSDYKNKIKRKDAFIDIANKLNFEEQEVRKKIESLLTQYRREKKALVLKSGMSSDDVKTPWYAYKYFHFLTKKNTPRITRSNTSEDGESNLFDSDLLETESGNEDSVSEQNSVEIENPSENVEQSVPHFDKKKKKLFLSPKRQKMSKRNYEDDDQTKEAYAIMKSCYSKIQENKQRDELKVYGESVEFRLRKIKNPITVCLLKNQIDNLLFKAEMDQYTHDSSLPQPLELNAPLLKPSTTTVTQQARDSPQLQNFNMQDYVQFY